MPKWIFQKTSTDQQGVCLLIQSYTKKVDEKHCQMLEKFCYGILKLHKDTVFYHEDGIAKPIPATVYGSALVHIRFPQI